MVTSLVKECSVDECLAAVRAKRLCERHYKSSRKYGDPLEVDHRKKRKSDPLQQCSVEYCRAPISLPGYCSRHYTSKVTKGSAVAIDVDVFFTGDPLTRTCKKCKEVKDASDFYTRSGRVSEERDGACKSCIYRQSRAYIQASKESEVFADISNPVVPYSKINHKATYSKVLRMYGLDGVKVKERIHAGEPCEMCQGKTAKMAIDHCHDTGAVRGLLCGNCNTGLGLLGDTVESLERAIKYLKKAKKG